MVVVVAVVVSADTDDEQCSTALGYCGHLVLMLSKYLGVPLRYRIIYKSSRSDICDDVVQAASQFPLYLKGSDERRFQCGCILLNKNIEHVTASHTLSALCLGPSSLCIIAALQTDAERARARVARQTLAEHAREHRHATKPRSAEVGAA